MRVIYVGVIKYLFVSSIKKFWFETFHLEFFIILEMKNHAWKRIKKCCQVAKLSRFLGHNF